MIGFGTGRCGTMSLARIINQCNRTMVQHEFRGYRTDWYVRNRRKTRRMLRFFKDQSSKGILAGDVALYWLPHILFLREAMPNMKLIHLYRPKEEVVASFLRRSSDERVRPSDTGRRRCLEDNMFPTIDGATPQQALGFYWEMYEQWAWSIEDVYHMSVYDLNGDLSGLFDYLEIPDQDRVFPTRTRYNESK